VFIGGEARGRLYNELTIAEYGNVDARLGLGYNAGQHNARFTLTGGRFWLDDVKTRDAAGATFDYRYLASKQDQINVGLNGSRNKFLPDALKVNNYDFYQASLGWLHGAADGRGAAGLTLLGGTELETAGRVDGDKPFIGLRVNLQYAFADGIGGFLLAGAQRGKYSEVNPLFGYKREDTLYDATFGFSWIIAKGWSLRPQAQYTYNRSNSALYEYDRTDVSMNVRLDL